MLAPIRFVDLPYWNGVIRVVEFYNCILIMYQHLRNLIPLEYFLPIILFILPIVMFHFCLSIIGLRFIPLVSPDMTFHFRTTTVSSIYVRIIMKYLTL